MVIKLFAKQIDPMGECLRCPHLGRSLPKMLALLGVCLKPWLAPLCLLYARLWTSMLLITLSR